MKRLTVYTDYKHSDQEEALVINLDAPLTTSNKQILYKYLFNFLETYNDLTYAEMLCGEDDDDNYVFTKKEFVFMMNKISLDGEYCLGENIHRYLYPTRVGIKIQENKDKSLTEIIENTE